MIPSTSRKVFLMKPPDASRINVSTKSQLFSSINPKSFSGLSGAELKSHLPFRFNRRALTFYYSFIIFEFKKNFSAMQSKEIIRILYSPWGLPSMRDKNKYFLAFRKFESVAKERTTCASERQWHKSKILFDA